MKNNKANASAFDSIKIEGGLLTSELLNKLRHYDLPGQSPTEYSVEEGLKLNDELGRYWRIAKSRWEKFNELRQREDVEKHQLTVDEWLVPLFEKVLDYRVSNNSGFEIGERTFPINHVTSENTVPLVLFSCDLSLDQGHTQFGEEGRKRSPSGLAQEYLNAEDRCLWSLVSNGLTLRLLRDNPAMTRPAYVEIDLERVFEEDLYVDFTVFWLLIHATRLQSKDGQPENCFLEQWRDQGESEGERVRKELRYSVTDALSILGTGFVSHPDNNPLRELIQSGELKTDQFFQELLRLIYRFLFLLTAEDRKVLLDPEAETSARDLYEKGYSICNLREQSRLRRHYDNNTDAWQQLIITFNGFATGQPKLGQPAMGGLFASDQCPHLEQSLLANRDLFKALYKLSFFVSKKVLVRINYRDMDTEELGSVYESLLELIPILSVKTPWEFGFEGVDEKAENSTDHQRKLSGSYYTPDSLVQELVHSALVPVIESRLEDGPANPAEAILNINVCDPTCGSGHFLLATARRLAIELARINAGTDQPTENDYRHALREVVSHCIYGVDINPLAVELCRIALWLETIEPGKPLGFLDSHIRVGNSLVGVIDPVVVNKGIPDSAYNAKIGDEREISTALKRQNRISPDQQALFSTHSTDLAVCAGGLLAMPEDSLEQVEEKHDAWVSVQESSACQNEKLRADLFTAAFFSRLTETNQNNVPTNLNIAILDQGGAMPDQLLQSVLELSSIHKFFHWNIAFPEVFENGGFDVLLGNPPWDVVKKEENDTLTAEQHDKLKNWFSIGLFDKAKGKKDLYKLFLLLGFQLIKSDGRLGVVIPVGIFVEDKPLPVRKMLLTNGSIEQLSIYQNTRKAFFKSVHSSYLFGTLVLTKIIKGKLKYSTIIKPGDKSNISYIEGDASALLGADLCIPMFHTQEYMRLYFSIMSALSKHRQLEYRVTAEFHASSDKAIINQAKDNESDWVIYKNDGINQFDYMYGKPVGFISDPGVREKVDSKGFPADLYLVRSVERLVFRDIARADDSRTLIACLLPYGYVSSYDLPILLPIDGLVDKAQLSFLLGYMNSLVFDFLVRPYVDKHVKGYVLHRLPIPSYDASNSYMKLISETANKMNNHCDRRYFNDRAIIDAAVLHVADMGKDDFKVLLSSFDVLVRSKIYTADCDDYESLVMTNYDHLLNSGINKVGVCT